MERLIFMQKKLAHLDCYLNETEQRLEKYEASQFKEVVFELRGELKSLELLIKNQDSGLVQSQVRDLGHTLQVLERLIIDVRLKISQTR